MSGAPLLEIEDLTVEFPSAKGWVRAVEDVSLQVEPGRVLGLVGESGSGKTVTALAILGLIRAQGGRVSGRIIFEGKDLTKLGERALSDVRGARIGMVFQQPIRSLNPAFTIGEQIGETIRRHKDVSRKEAMEQVVALLDRVHIPEPAKRAKQYPHEFSGGMCQRAMIAMALSCSPSLLIADEPTTALDVTVQAVVLELMRELQHELGVAILFVSHDLGVIAEMADEVAVMYAGQIVETASVEELFTGPRHPYTAGLMAAVPRVGQGRRLVAIDGNVPDPGHHPSGCRFHPRCAYAVAMRCDSEAIPLLPCGDEHETRCIRASELALEGVTVS
jgi:oligopeptide/dipeptide ABC transporter ATP-binding protein